MRRIVRTMRLRGDKESLEAYRKAHDEIWPEIREGILSVGVREMDIYLLGDLAVMVMEVDETLDIEAAFARLATLPRQDEWEAHVARFQQCNPGDTSSDKWHDMTRIFSLTKNPCLLD